MEAHASERATLLATRTAPQTADGINSHGAMLGGSLLRLAVKRSFETQQFTTTAYGD
jgi:hypothetical protein